MSNETQTRPIAADLGPEWFRETTSVFYYQRMPDKSDVNMTARLIAAAVLPFAGADRVTVDIAPDFAPSRAASLLDAIDNDKAAPPQRFRVTYRVEFEYATPPTHSGASGKIQRYGSLFTFPDFYYDDKRPAERYARIVAELERMGSQIVAAAIRANPVNLKSV